MKIPPPDPRTTTVHLRRDLIDLNWSDRAIARMVSSGQWVRIRHGAYCDAFEWRHLDAPGRHLVTTRAVLKQAKTELAVSHVSALPWYDAPLWNLDLDDVNVTRTDGRIGRHEAGVHQHCGQLIDTDTVDHGGVVVTSPTRTLLEVTTQAGVEESLVVANHLLHANLTTLEQVESRYRDHTCSMNHWPRTLATDLVVLLARPKVESVGESRTFFLLWSQHLPLPEVQYDITDEHGRVIHTVDFAWPELGVFLELDGKVKYEKYLRPGQRASDVVVREKRREERICRLTGWRCIRLIWADLQRPRQTADQIRLFLYAARTS